MRPISSVWSHFTKEENGRKKTAVCRYCHKRYMFPNATKMTKHIEKCLKKPLDMAFSFTSQPEVIPCIEYENAAIPDPDLTGLENPVVIDNWNVSTNSSNVESTSSSVYCVPQVKKTTSQSVLHTFVDAMSVSEGDKLDAALARAIYSSNSPLSLTENKY